MSNLVQLYCDEIKNNNLTIENVPNKLKEQVHERLNNEASDGELNA